MSKAYASQQPQGYHNYIKNVAIVGAGGQCGKFIVESLLKNGTQNVTAITREGSTNKIADGVTPKYVNYDDQDSLVAALRGQDALIITMGVLAPPSQVAKLTEAAATAEVPWILPNEFGMDGTNEELGAAMIIGPMKKKDRDLIDSLGKSSWIGVACSFWYEFSLAGGDTRFGFDLKNRTALFYDNGTTKISTSTFPQTGRAVANLLALKILPDDENDTSPTLSDYRSKYIHIASFTVNQRDMLDSLIRVTGTTLSDWKITEAPVEEYYQSNMKKLQQGDMSGYARAMYSRLFFKDAPGDQKAIYGLDNEKLGLPTEDLDEWTKVAVEMDKAGYFDEEANIYKQQRERQAASSK